LYRNNHLPSTAFPGTGRVVLVDEGDKRIRAICTINLCLVFDDGRIAGTLDIPDGLQSDIIIISRDSGEVLYFGTANDEG
jgi:hypothetical protein